MKNVVESINKQRDYERRGRRRWGLKLPVFIKQRTVTGSVKLTVGKTTNVSASGCYVLARGPVDPEPVSYLYVESPRSAFFSNPPTYCRFKAKILRIEQIKDGVIRKFGLGIKLTSLPVIVARDAIAK